MVSPRNRITEGPVQPGRARAVDRRENSEGEIMSEKRVLNQREAMEALLRGERLTVDKPWFQGWYIHLENDRIVEWNGSPSGVTSDEYFVWEPPTFGIVDMLRHLENGGMARHATFPGLKFREGNGLPMLAKYITGWELLDKNGNRVYEVATK